MNSLPHMPTHPDDPPVRDPHAADVVIRPDRDTWLHLKPERRDPVMDASVWRAKGAQKRDREQAIADTLEIAAAELDRLNLQDSVDALALAEHLLDREARNCGASVITWTVSDKQAAIRRAALALRTDDVAWRRVRHARMTQAVYDALQKEMHARLYLPEDELWTLCQSIASAAWRAAREAVDGSDPVTAREWAQARLALIGEERTR